MASIPDGYGIIAGRSRRTAQAALDAAARAGVDPQEVRSVPEGYVVPLAVIEAYHGVGTTASSDEPTPTEEWKNAEIRDWAEAHGVELNGATTKADMLAAIDGAGSQ
jgi:hypothetical protein